MKAAELFLKCLENEGVEYIFGVPGEENLDLMDALVDSPIQFITTRHEQGAAFMADVYGRLTGRAGVCLSTLGPGATNLVTGVADANMDRAPLVAIAGQAATTRLHKESHQVLDLVSLFQPITGYSSRILEPEIIPEVVRKAFKHAQGISPSASFIEFPENIAEEMVDEQPLPVITQHHPYPSSARVEEVAKIISEAKSPIILAGHGVIRAGASEALADFSEQLCIPVANTFMAKGVIPFKHPMALGSAGLQAKDYVMMGFDTADVIICIGYDLVEYHPYLWHPSKDRCLLHIAQTPAEVDAHYSVHSGLVGDIAEGLKRVQAVAQRHQCTHNREMRESLIKDMDEHKDDTSVPMKPQKIIWDLRTAMNKEDIAISDVGAHKMWMARMFRSELPNTCLISNGFASMGIALPGAIAAKLVNPNKNIVAVTGDAGFMMNVQEIETAMRIGTPIVILIWNDSAYGLIEWKQEAQFGRTSGIDFTNPDFVQLAESFGAWGYRIKEGDDLQEVLLEAFQQNRVAIIDCPVDYSENMKLTKKLGETVN